MIISIIANVVMIVKGQQGIPLDGLQHVLRQTGHGMTRERMHGPSRGFEGDSIGRV